MRIKGSNKADTLVASNGDDFISGGRGNDWIEGGKGNDTMTGGVGRDTFVLRADGGHDIVTDFSISDGDVVMLDSQTGVYDGILVWGPLSDGMQIVNSHGTSVGTIHQADYNGDGLMDTQFEMSSGATLTLLGVVTAQLNGSSLYGG